MVWGVVGMYGCYGKALPDDVLTTQYAADNDIVCS